MSLIIYTCKFQHSFHSFKEKFEYLAITVHRQGKSLPCESDGNAHCLTQGCK